MRLLVPYRLATIAVLALTASIGLAQAPDPKAEAAALDQKIIAIAKKDSEIMKNLTYLSDFIGPRLTGSDAAKHANEWIANKMKSYGLENVHLEPWTIPVGWERGTATAKIIQPNNGRGIILASAGWTPGTNGKVQGDVVILTARSTKELAEYKGKLKGAIVLRGAPAEVRPITDLSFTPGGGRPTPKDKDADPKKETDSKKDPEAKKDGDAPPDPKFPNGRQNIEQMMAFQRELAEFLRTEGVQVLLQDAAKPHGLLTTTGSWRSSMRGGADRVNASEMLPAAFVAHEHYQLLHRLAQRKDAKTRIEIEITNTLVPGPITVYNTIGEIKGTEKPDEFVIIGAHLDSWDLAQGTTDNGTGSCVVLEAARTLVRSGIKPRRTIRFILFTGEEQGLMGSKAYTERHKDELPKMSMCLVHDTGTGKAIGIGTQGRPTIKPILDAELTSLIALGLKDINTKSLQGSDHASFDQAGVPGFAFQQEWSEYRFTHHSQSDTLDKAHEVDLIQGTQVMAVTALRVANLPELLPRDKPARKFGKDTEKKDPEKKVPEKK
jgi:hypothetical protein